VLGTVHTAEGAYFEGDGGQLSPKLVYDRITASVLEIMDSHGTSLNICMMNTSITNETMSKFQLSATSHRESGSH
jgi:hypothetical protein